MPSEPLFEDRSYPVPDAIAVTVAASTTAPEESRTCPLRLPVVICAREEAASSKKVNKPSSSRVPRILETSLRMLHIEMMGF